MNSPFQKTNEINKQRKKVNENKTACFIFQKNWLVNHNCPFHAQYDHKYKPRSSNSRSRSASWSLSPCKRPLVARAIDGGICNRNSVWPRRPPAIAAWDCAWAWSCWQVAYILKVVAIKNTPSTSQSYISKKKTSLTITTLKLIIISKERHEFTNFRIQLKNRRNIPGN